MWCFFSSLHDIMQLVNDFIPAECVSACMSRVCFCESMQTCFYPRKSGVCVHVCG